MNVKYFKSIIGVTAVVLFTGLSVLAEETPVVHQVSGEIGWIDIKLGKLVLQNETSQGRVEKTEYRINQNETRVIDPRDKKFLTVENLREGQYITIDLTDGQEEKPVKLITTGPKQVPIFQKSDADIVVLGLNMRKLWEEHIVYTRNYIISALANLEDKDVVEKRLLRNQDDIGELIAKYYGDEAGGKLTVLLRDHILIATEVIKAAQMENSKELARAQKRWNMNADDISGFLSKVNHHWAINDMSTMLRKHLEYTTAEMVFRLKKDWTADVDAYDRGHHHMLMFADVMTEGIVKQFPEKFTQQ